MTKTELINAVAEKNSISKKDAGTYVDSVLDTMVDTLVKGEDVNLVGYFKLSVVERAAREGRNPQTGEKINIGASRGIKFSASKNLKQKVRN